MDKLSAAGVVEEFLDQWRNSDLRDKMPEPQLIDNGPRVELTAIGVYGPHQNKGHASRALRLLTTLCDDNRVAIELVARPLPPNLSRMPGCPATLSIDQLVAWYTRYGFIETTAQGDDTRTMVREPRKA